MPGDFGSLPYYHLPHISVKRDKRMTRVGSEMERKFVGPVDPQEFLDEFFPQISLEKEFMKQELWEVGHGDGIHKEAQMYEPMIKIMESYCPDLSFIDTSQDPDDTNWAHQPGLTTPDISAYIKEAGVTRNDITRTEFFMELKWAETADGFDDGSDDIIEEDAPFEKNTQQARDTRAELTTYAGAQLTSQFRTHTFSIQITRKNARLIRWDREGAVVTRKFCYYEEPFLVDFLWRYNQASPETRGYDSSVTEIKDPLRAQEVRDALKMDDNDRVWQFEFTDENSAEHAFVGGKLDFQGSGSPVGCCTRGFLVLDNQGVRRYLKDAWRPLDYAVDKEANMYASLKAHGVPHIPDVMASGDAVGHWQTTRTREYSSASFPDVVLHSHQHCFTVFIQCGRNISTFKNNYELLQCMSHAIEASYEAWDKAKVIHRDISVANILISDEGEGLLVNWEYSKPVSLPEPEPAERVGTWQFMAAILLSKKPCDVEHSLIDDQESFYHVLCWLTLMYGRHGLTAEEVEDQIARSYDGGRPPSEAKGGDGKKVDFIDRYMCSEAKLIRSPLSNLIYNLELMFIGRYYISWYSPDMDKDGYKPDDLDWAMVHYNEDKLRVINKPTWMLERFNKVLEGKEELIQQTRSPERDITSSVFGGDGSRRRKKTESEVEAEANEEKASKRARSDF
ncbi:hypothetical protein VNI00_009077 [Paramarasmius palmivorus]|uniref:Fungal-type protein kinase domain-containing protein n=1 Tax=Paramarasmius palmivorus TaxID=297713 RepID=A0AAW0CSF7_9AGAR